IGYCRKGGEIQQKIQKGLINYYGCVSKGLLDLISWRLFYFCVMDQVILFDDPAIRGGLLPFTFTRPVAEIRVGILKIMEKWEKHLNLVLGFLTQDYLTSKFGFDYVPSLLINGALCPNEGLISAIKKLGHNQALWHKNSLLALSLKDPGSFSIEM